MFLGWSNKKCITALRCCDKNELALSAVMQIQSQIVHNAAHTLCLKKVPTFKLFVTLSNLNPFSNFALLESV